MKAVVALLIACAVAGAVATDSTDVASFNTRDADQLEVEFEAADESGMEVESDATTEATLVDSAEVAAADSVEFEDELAESADDSASDESEQTEAENAADELDTDAADAAVEAAEMEESQAGEHNVEQGFKSFTAASLNAEVDNMAALKARKCTPEANIKCPDGSVVYTKITRPPDYNGCGPASGVLITDKTIGGQFSPCCNNHDICYSVARSTKDACDTAFYNCMKDVCKSSALCKGKAWIYYQAVAVGGCSAWKASRLRKGCLTGPNAASDPGRNMTTHATPAQTAAAAKFFTGAENSAANVAGHSSVLQSSPLARPAILRGTASTGKTGGGKMGRF